MDTYIDPLVIPFVDSLFDQILRNQNLTLGFHNFTMDEKLLILQKAGFCGKSNRTVTDEDVIISHSNYKAHKIISKYIFPVFLIIGLVLNTASAIVFRQRTMRYRHMSTNIFMKALALADIIFLLFGITTKWLGEVSESSIQDKSNFLCKAGTFLSYTNSHFAVWVIVAVTVERYLIACHARLIPKSDRLRRARITLIILISIFIVINTHLLWTVELEEEIYNCKIVRKCAPTVTHSYFIRKIWPVIDACIYSFIPTLVIITSNVLIILKMNSSAATRTVFKFNQNLPEKKQGMKNFKITVMLLTLSFTFVITTFPMSIAMIIINASPGQMQDPSHLARQWLLRTISDFFMYLNHSINFILYCIANQNFRTILMRALRFKRKRLITVPTEEDFKEDFDLTETLDSSNLPDINISLSVFQVDARSDTNGN